MATARKLNKFHKGGYKKRKGRPQGVSRSGLPKTYPSHINPHLRAIKLG
jgi:hypothetical protein